MYPPAARQPIDASGHRCLARVDEVEYRLWLRPSLQAGAALLFATHHATPSRFQSGHLHIEVLFDGRGAYVSDFGLASVHFGRALKMTVFVFSKQTQS